MPTELPLGLFSRADADNVKAFASGASSKFLVAESDGGEGDSYYLFKSILGTLVENDTCIVMIVNDTNSPLVLNGDPTLIHGWWSGAPTSNTIPASVDGMPTYGYFAFSRYTDSATGVEGAIQFSAQADLPDGVTIGFQIPGTSSWQMQVAVLTGNSAASCATNLDNSKYGTLSSCQTSKSNELQTATTTVSLNMQVQYTTVEWEDDSDVGGSLPTENQQYYYIAVAYVQSVTQ